MHDGKEFRRHRGGVGGIRGRWWARRVVCGFTDGFGGAIGGAKVLGVPDWRWLVRGGGLGGGAGGPAWRGLGGGAGGFGGGGAARRIWWRRGVAGRGGGSGGGIGGGLGGGSGGRYMGVAQGSGGRVRRICCLRRKYRLLRMSERLRA
ncbi:uncharacterized protein A4U43_C08F9520 [Asparagus officinalis]|nr:uncharacterized protein A4U43_C08F9520 [Asparagus officinalis]